MIIKSSYQQRELRFLLPAILNPQEMGRGIIDAIFFPEKKKQETTSSGCFCLSVVVFSLCAALRIAQKELILQK